MSIPDYFSIYAYVALAFGVAVEGKAVAFIAGILAHHGQFSVGMVVIASIIGTFIANQLFFYVGRWLKHRKNNFLEGDPTKHRHWKKLCRKDRMDKIEAIFNRSPFAIILIFRFIPGFRIMAPIVIGMLKFGKLKYLIYDIVCVMMSSTFIVVLGFYFGGLVERVCGRLEEHGFLIAIIVALIAIISTLFRRYRRRKRFNSLENSL